jgi:2'-5' RNA ligase
MRLFLGISPPKEIINSFKNIQLSLNQFKKYLRFVKSDHIHVTLRYLGNEISKETYELISSRLEKIAKSHRGFNIQIKEVNYGFPGRYWPRILYVGCKQSEGLLRLYNSIHSSLNSLQCDEIFYDQRKDNPSFHITLARTKSKLTKDVVRNIRNSIKKSELYEGFQVKSFSLIESTLQTDGPVYKVLDKFILQ